MIIFLLDDDRRSMTQMDTYIQEYAKKMNVSMKLQGFTDPDLFLKAYDESEDKPYLVILRVEMEKMSGIEVARKLRGQGSLVRLILVGDTEKYAMDAFDVHADGYLKRPVLYQDVANAMGRFRTRLATESHTIQVRSERSKVDIHTSDILYAESIGHNVWIYCKEGEYKTPLTMVKLTEELQVERSFISCGRSYLVNMAHISQMENEVIIMTDGSRVPIPVRLRKIIAEKYGEYCNEWK